MHRRLRPICSPPVGNRPQVLALSKVGCKSPAEDSLDGRGIFVLVRSEDEVVNEDIVIASEDCRLRLDMGKQGASSSQHRHQLKTRGDAGHSHLRIGHGCEPLGIAGGKGLGGLENSRTVLVQEAKDRRRLIRAERDEGDMLAFCASCLGTFSTLCCSKCNPPHSHDFAHAPRADIASRESSLS